MNSILNLLRTSRIALEPEQWDSLDRLRLTQELALDSAPAKIPISTQLKRTIETLFSFLPSSNLRVAADFVAI
jgi:hypothetical protein